MANETPMNISKYYKSFSGTDTLVFAMFPGSQPVVLGTITTISYSCYRTKKPVIHLGHVNINGVTRGSRIYAGTMIFTLINQYWLYELQHQEATSWLKGDIKADELPLFDLMIVSANEYGSYVTMYIYGVDFTDNAQVISIEDMFTENTFSFVARDVQDFKAGNVFESQITGTSGNPLISTIKTANISYENLDLDTLAYQQTELKRKANNEYEEKNQYKASFPGELYYNGGSPVIGAKIGDIQKQLNLLGYATSVNNMYDDETKKAVKDFQSFNGYFNNLGVYDRTTHNLLQNALIEKEAERPLSTSIVINQSGCEVYEHPNKNSSVTMIKPYQAEVELLGRYDEQEIQNNKEYEMSKKEIGFEYYAIKEGYVRTENVYTPGFENNDIQFPTIVLHTYSNYVGMFQELLYSIYGSFEHTENVLDKETLTVLHLVQKEHGLEETNYIDQTVWQSIVSLTPEVSFTLLKSKNIKLESKVIPGVYSVLNTDNAFLNSLLDMTLFSSTECNVKLTAICSYKNGKQNVISNTVSISNAQTLPSKTLLSSLSYQKEYGTPNKVQYFVHINGDNTYSWTLSILEQEE